MKELKFFKKQGERIKNMEPLETKGDPSISNKWEDCYGFPLGDEYVVRFEKDEKRYEMYFTEYQYKKIEQLTHPWTDNEILNVSGLAKKIWGDTEVEKNVLRRRLEQKAERDTFTEDERKAIRKAVVEFYLEVLECI